jgi:glutamine amidotransferase
MIDIAVVDYGMGNLRSVSKALEHVAPNKNVVVTSRPADIKQASQVVFPGQGAMPDCMRDLESRGLRDAIVDAAATKPFLGICIGLQLLFEHSEEGDAAGLGILSGNVKRFSANEMHDETGNKLKVPHMGWNQVYQTQAHPMWKDIADGERFYYVHSYYVQPQDEN